MTYFSTKNELTKLISGYSHQNSLYLVPMALNNLCQLYFDDLIRIHWKLKGDELKQVFKLQTYEIIESGKQINSFVDGIQFVCGLYQNGRRPHPSTTKSVLTLYVKATYIPQNISSLITVLHFKCIRTGSNFKTYAKFTKENNRKICVGWYNDVIPLNECRYKSELSFLCNIDILHINYKNEYIEIIKPIQTIEYKTVNIAHKERNIKVNKLWNLVQSDCFGIDNIWCLRIYDLKPNQRNKIQFEMQLIRKPVGIKSITVKYSIKLNEKNENNIEKIEDIVQNCDGDGFWSQYTQTGLTYQYPQFTIYNLQIIASEYL